MSELSNVLIKDVAAIVEQLWSTRDGLIVPDTASVKLGNDRVVLDAVLFYADLADSTELAVLGREKAAEVYKAYLQGVTKLIKTNGGEVRSFDGDRVMGVFVGSRKNTAAVTCGLHVNWFFTRALVPKFTTFYPNLAGFPFDQTVGIDAGPIHVARGGVRNDNDLIWVGRAPNIAAKLSAIRHDSNSILITPDVYNWLHPSVKTDEATGQAMWNPYTWKDGERFGVDTVYGSKWWWRP